MVISLLLEKIIQARLEGVTITEKAVLLSLISYMSIDDDNRLSCNVSKNTIAKLTGSTRSAVNKALTKLENKGFISSVKRFDKSKIYTWSGIDKKESFIDEYN